MEKNQQNYKNLSIVIPVYNEEKYITEILSRVVKADSLKLTKEIIIVNDGSTDKTRAILDKLEKEYKRKKINISIFHKKNGGKGTAVKYGFTKTHGDIVIVQDADLEYDPNDYTLLLSPFFRSSADVVFGSRLVTAEPHRVLYYWHSVINHFFTTLSNIFTNLNLTDMETGYKAFRGELIREIAPKLESAKFGFEPEITARIAKVKGVKIYEVGISYSGRTYEEGKKIGWQDGVRAIWEIIKYNLLS